MSDGDDDGVPTLSAHTLAALQEFYSETRTGLDRSVQPSDQFAVGAVEEDWRMSQFWYSDETAARLAEEVVREAGEGGRIACVMSAAVLEYDRRFAAYGEDFVYYDYNRPLSLPAGVAPRSFDVVLADPPYLSEECLSKVAETIQHLSRGKVLLCTGAIMEKLAGELLGVTMCSFLPKHNRNLSNEFRCFVNYPSRLS
uniref:EEF1A lysine methyltransferase 1 n=1 Tax=Salarias fasciatus TaxID=181472 RepID=A0A672HQC0_SALFA